MLLSQLGWMAWLGFGSIWDEQDLGGSKIDWDPSTLGSKSSIRVIYYWVELVCRKESRISHDFFWMESNLFGLPNSIVPGLVRTLSYGVDLNDLGWFLIWVSPSQHSISAAQFNNPVDIQFKTLTI